MSDTSRDKFVKSLRKVIKNSTSATERTEARKLYAKLVLGEGASADDTASDAGNEIIDGKIDLVPLGEMNREPSEYDITVRQAMSAHPDDGLGCLLMLVQPARWMQGLWGDHPEGWTNARDNNKLLTFADARQLIDARIVELGLNAEKVYAYPKSHSTWQDKHAFLNLPFAEQMQMFRPLTGKD